jgi:type VI secretion system secreted protein Hcp
MKKLLPLLLVLCTAVIAHAAEPIQVTIKGNRQGNIKGDGPGDTITALGYEQQSLVPRDATSGLPSGARRYEPLKIVKAIDRATPGIYSAFATNETVTITLDFFTKGSATPYYTIKLESARITEVRDWKVNTRDLSADRAGDLQEVSIYFRKITITHSDGTTFQDDWGTN